MTISKDQARELARQFREVSVAVGDYRFENWGTLTAAQRQQLEDSEWTLLNTSSDLVSRAVGLVLDDVEDELRAIAAVTKRAKSAVKAVNDAKHVISLAAAVIGLGGAIVAAAISKTAVPVMNAVIDLSATLDEVT